MFKKLVEKLKKLLLNSVPKQSNPIAAKAQDAAIKDLLAKADEVVKIVDNAEKEIHQEVVKAVNEIKKKGRPAKSGTTPSKKKPGSKKNGGGGGGDSQVA